MRSGPIRTGIVGLGFGRQVHLPALRLDRRFDVVALCGRSQSRTRDQADRCGILRAFDDWREMVTDPDIDAVTIAVAPDDQPEIALSALNAGKAVFCEKPLARSLHQAAMLARMARRTGLANMVDFEFPALELWQKARSLLYAGSIGKLQHISVNWSVRRRRRDPEKSGDWKDDAHRGGGLLNNFGSHVLDYLGWFAGQAVRVQGALQHGGEGTQASIQQVLLNLQFSQEVTASVTLSYCEGPENHHRIDLRGDAGSMVLENRGRDYALGFRLWLQAHHGEEEIKIVRPGVEVDDGRIVPVSTLIRRFGNWITLGKPARPDFAQGLLVQGLLEATNFSLAREGWVDVASFQKSLSAAREVPAWAVTLQQQLEEARRQAQTQEINYV